MGDIAISLANANDPLIKAIHLIMPGLAALRIEEVKMEAILLTEIGTNKRIVRPRLLCECCYKQQ